MSPRVWKKPLTLIYDNNYKYGNSLYGGAIGDIERKYLNAMSRTRLPLDRPDVNMSTFAGSSLMPGAMTSTTDHSPSDYRSFGGSVASRSAYEDDLYDLRRIRSYGDFPAYRSKPVADHWVSSQNTFSEVEHELEERKSARRRRRQRPIEKVEFPEVPTFSERAADRVDTSHWADKCRQLQSEINHLSQRVSEAETKVKSESKHKIQQGITELTLMMDDTVRQNAELQKVIKMQAKQLAELQSHYDEAQRHMTEAAEDLNSTHRRCNAMQAEIEALRHTIDQTIRNRDGSLRL